MISVYSIIFLKADWHGLTTFGSLPKKFVVFASFIEKIVSSANSQFNSKSAVLIFHLWQLHQDEASTTQSKNGKVLVLRFGYILNNFPKRVKTFKRVETLKYTKIALKRDNYTIYIHYKDIFSYTKKMSLLKIECTVKKQLWCVVKIIISLYTSFNVKEKCTHDAAEQVSFPQRMIQFA